jgi:hypothetical protein
MRSVCFALVFFSSLPAFAGDGAFTFLPPLVASDPQVVGNVDAAAHPTVWVFSLVKGTGYFADLSSDVHVEGNHFVVKWKVPALPPTDFRVTVSYDNFGLLGTIDVPGASLSANQTVPIKFFFNGCLEQTCPGANQCHVASTCDPSTFQCSTPPIVCGQPIDACHTVACDETLGLCTHPGLAGEYPPGPYAAAVGSTMPNLSYDGVLYSARTTETTIPMSHYFQDGLAQVLVISQCATWCSPCASQAGFLKNLATQPGYDQGRIAGLELLAQNQQSAPPTLLNVEAYSGATHDDCAADAAMSLESLFGVSVADYGFPYTVVVRTRDMSIRWVNLGFDEAGLQAAIDGALADNTPENACVPQ